jgi:hypothetical protein
MYDREEFTDFTIELFEINYKGKSVKFHLRANSTLKDRGRIFALDENNREYTGLSYYLNGNLVRDPVISLNEWTSIGVSFLTPLTFDSYLGSLNITGPAIFNNISYYQANSLTQIQQRLIRTWVQVLRDGVETLDWNFWQNNFTWDGMLNVGSTEFYSIDPSDIYNTYIGNNKIVIDDGQGLVYKPEKLKVYTGIEWSSSVSTPV